MEQLHWVKILQESEELPQDLAFFGSRSFVIADEDPQTHHDSRTLHIVLSLLQYLAAASVFPTSN